MIVNGRSEALRGHEVLLFTMRRSPPDSRGIEARRDRSGVDHFDEVGDALVDGEACVRTADSSLDPARSHEQQRSGVAAVSGGVAAHERVQRGLGAAVDLEAAAFVVGDAACPEDMTAIVPFGATRSSSPSITRIGLSALVTISRVNSSVEMSAMVSSGFVCVTPALTNSRSKVREARRSCRSTMCSGR